MRRRVLLWAFAAGSGVLGCLLVLQPRPAASLASLSRSAAPKASLERAAPLQLEDVSLDWNIAVSHEQSSDPLSSLSETLGAGVCVLDFNRDGWMDLFFVGGRGHTRDYGRQSWWQESQGNRLLVNKGNRRFEDVTAAMHLDASMWGMGCAVADLDNDGYSDLVVTGVGGNRVFRNQSGTSFEDVTSRSGVQNDRWSTGVAVADFNGDGLLDFYVSNYVRFEKGARTFERTSGFRPAADIAFDQTLFDPEPNRLYVNRGGFRFEDVAASLGVSDALGRGLGVRWLDLNGDRWPDLFVINDHDTPNQVYLNDRGRAFTRGSGENTAFEIAGAHDAAFADFDNDGRPELFLSRGRGRPSVLLAFSAVEGRFVDTAWRRGLAAQDLLAFSGWSAVAADVDNDGDLDLYLANGSTLPDADARFVPQAQPSSLYVNDGHGGFGPAPQRSDRHRAYSSRGAIAADLDNDGQLELIVASNNDPLEVLSVGGAHGNWLTVDLSANRDVEVYGGTISVEVDGLTLTRPLGADPHFLSQGDPRLHLGLGHATHVQHLDIRWADGKRSAFRDVAVNQVVAIDRESRSLRGKTYPPPGSSRFASAVARREPEALLCLARILLSGTGGAGEIADLNALYEASPTEVRVALLEHLPAELDAPHLALVARALRDGSPSVRSTAVGILRRAELERSVGWLVPLLDDPDPGVQCAVTEAFRFFFDEEEAVTQRKALAVPALGRLLATGAARTKICAAAALAAAESPRAVLPLLDLIRGPDDDPVRSAAARALGLIRDGRAIGPLRAVVADATTGAATVAAGLVALVRLRDPNVRQLLTQILQPPGPAAARPSRLQFEVLAQLFDAQDGSVIDRPELESYLEKLSRLVAPAPRGTGLEVALSQLHALAASKAPRFLSALTTAASSPSEEVQGEALLALASIDSPAAQRAFETRAIVAPSNVWRSLLMRLGKAHTSPELITRLFERPGGSDIALQLLRKEPRDVASVALSALMAKRWGKEAATSLFKACVEARLGPRKVNPAYEGSAVPAQLRSWYIQCLLQPSASRDASESALRLHARSLVAAVLQDSSLTREEQTSTLLATAGLDAMIAKTWLVPRLAELTLAELPPALGALGATGTAPLAHDFLLSLLNDSTKPDPVRLQAAELLAATDRERVLTALSERSGGI
jgi:HEAT repeat protein